MRRPLKTLIILAVGLDLWAVGPAFQVAGAQTALGLPPSTLRSVPPPSRRAVTPLSGQLSGWALPNDAPQLLDVPDFPRGLRKTALQGAFKGTGIGAELVDSATSRSSQWTSSQWTLVVLRVNSSDRAVRLDSLRVTARGDQGSALSTLPGLYDRAGTRLREMAGGQSVLLACWIALPQEGRGDSALRGTEQAAQLTLLQGDSQMSFSLPRR